MKIHALILAFLPFTFVACQSMPSGSKMHAHTPSTMQNASQILTQYVWKYQPSETSHPIQLSFMQDRLGIATGCNQQSTAWKIENNQLVTSALVSTLKACHPNLMKNEQISRQMFEQQSHEYRLNTSSIEHPELTLILAEGRTVQFTGTMTPEAKYQTQAHTIFLEISPEVKQCTGVTQQNCLQVREVKYDDKGIKTQVDKDWALFYDIIQGYEHQSNQRDIIRVKRYERSNPAADQSKYVYIYDMTVEQEQIQPTQTP